MTDRELIRNLEDKMLFIKPEHQELMAADIARIRKLFKLHYKEFFSARDLKKFIWLSLEKRVKKEAVNNMVDQCHAGLPKLEPTRITPEMAWERRESLHYYTERMDVPSGRRKPTLEEVEELLTD